MSRRWGENKQTISTLLKDIRKEAKFTQKELAETLGEHQSYVSKYESGGKSLDYMEVRAICSVCNLSLVKFENRLTKALEKDSKINELLSSHGLTR